MATLESGAIETPPWLAGPSEQRLREISHVTALRLPYSFQYANSILMDAVALQRLAAQFRRCANAYTSPFLRLLPEIVSEVFMHVAEIEPAGTASLGWIRLGHVSHACRLELLRMHGLWASVVCNVAPAARPEVLTRAGGMPLSICLKAGRVAEVGSERVDFAMQNITQARRVEIKESKGTGVLWTYAPHELSGRSFQHLEELNVTLSRHEGHIDYPDWLGTGVYAMEPVHAPRLRTLYLAHVYIPFSPENLTSLSLVRTRFRKDGAIAISNELLPSPEKFLDMLARCVNVRSLGLLQCIPTITPLAPCLRSSRGIELPSLKMLHLGAPLSEVIALWSHLTLLPVEASIMLKPEYTEFPRATGGFVDPMRFSLFPALLEPFGRTGITAMAFETNNDTFTTQCGFFKPTPNFVTSTREGLSIYSEDDGLLGENYVSFLDVWLHQCMWDGNSPLSQFIDCIPGPFLAQIETLDVYDVYDEDLRRLFIRLPNLHTLHLRSPRSSSLALLVVEKSESFASTTPADTTFLLPKLTHLRLLDTEVGNVVAEYEHMPHYDDILNILISRSDAGISLLSLHMKGLRNFGDCMTGDTFLARIRALVPGEVVVNADVLSREHVSVA